MKRGSIREQIDFMVAGADPQHHLRRRNFKELRIFLIFELYCVFLLLIGENADFQKLKKFHHKSFFDRSI